MEIKAEVLIPSQTGKHSNNYMIEEAAIAASLNPFSNRETFKHEEIVNSS